MTLVNYSKTLLCVEDVCTAGSETPVCLFKNTSFYRTFQWLEGKKKRLQQRLISVNFAKFLRTSFDITPPGDCFLCLSVNLEKFSRSPLLYITSEKLLISCTSCRISTTRYNKKYFTSSFQTFYTKTRRSYSKAFFYVEPLKIICE